MLTKPRFLLSLSKKLDFFTTAKITIMIIMIKIIVITMLIIIIIMIIKWNLEVVNQQRTLCVPKKKKTKWFSLFTFVLFLFLGVAIRFYIYIYIYIYIYALSVHTRSLTAAWVCFLRLNFTPSQIIIAGIFLRRGNRIIMNLIFISFGSFFFFSFLTSALTC